MAKEINWQAKYEVLAKGVTAMEVTIAELQASLAESQRVGSHLSGNQIHQNAIVQQEFDRTNKRMNELHEENNQLRAEIQRLKNGD